MVVCPGISPFLHLNPASVVDLGPPVWWQLAKSEFGTVHRFLGPSI